GGTYDLTSAYSAGVTGLPALSGQLTINGHGATIRRSSAGGTPAFRIFAISASANVQLNDLIISNGRITRAGSFGVGGGIYNQGVLTLNSTAVQNNTVAAGDGDDALGGGIANYGTLKLNGSVVANNHATAGKATGAGAAGIGFGGGIYS